MWNVLQIILLPSLSCMGHDGVLFEVGVELPHVYESLMSPVCRNIELILIEVYISQTIVIPVHDVLCF